MQADDRAQLLYFSGNSPESIANFSQKYQISALDSAVSLASHPDLDLIVIANVNQAHASIARTALKSGKHVIVEYPLAFHPAAAIIDKTTPLDRYGRAKVITNQESLLSQGKVVMDGSVENPVWRLAEQAARRARRGLWTTLPLLTAHQMGEGTGEFSLVRGRVQSFFQSYDDRYLNFGPDWKTDFTLRIPRRYWKQFPDTKKLVGKNIEARGILHTRNGAMITLLSPGQIEVLP